MIFVKKTYDELAHMKESLIHLEMTLVVDDDDEEEIIPSLAE